MPNQITVTAKTGPARQVTDGLITPVTSLVFDFIHKVLHVYRDSEHAEYDLAGVTVVTDTITGDTHIFLVS